MKNYKKIGLKIIGIFALLVLFSMIPFNCGGVSEKQAVDISSLWIKKNKRLDDKAYIALVESQGEEWLVTVNASGCVVYIVVDKCGHIWDAAGISAGCDYGVKYPIMEEDGIFKILKNNLDYLRAGSLP